MVFNPIDNSNKGTTNTFSTPIIQKTRNNLTTAERQAMMDLSRDPTIVIRAADKGGGIVILDYSYYRTEILQQLADHTVCRKLQGDPTSTFFQRISQTVGIAVQAGFLSDSIARFLQVQHSRIPILYTIPKIHKNAQQPPGRLIVSARGGLLEPLGKYIDGICKPVLSQLPNLLKDTPHLLSLLQQVKLPEGNIVLATLDVTSLFTVIPPEEGIAAFRDTIVQSNIYQGPPVELIIELLRITLECNYFRFEKQFFLQIAGTAMGASMACICHGGPWCEPGLAHHVVGV